MNRIVTFGTFDLYHVGHVNILDRAAELGDTVIVGVSSDVFNMSKKGHLPIIPENQRMRIVSSHRAVSHVFLEESMELKRQYLEEHRADVLVMGDDWVGRFDYLRDTCKVVYVPRTPDVSTTQIIERVNNIT
jgi:glycerol-3-phosphate cytidylyltransferase